MEFSDNYITFRPIGIIHSPFKNPKGTPLQSAAASGKKATVEVFPEFGTGLTDIEEFSHIILLYYFHLAISPKMKVIPYLDTKPHGVFTTRVPARPNPIGMSVVRLVSRNENILSIDGCDILDQTPLLDIKPFVPKYNLGVQDLEVIQIGWVARVISNLTNISDDSRFSIQK